MAFWASCLALLCAAGLLAQGPSPTRVLFIGNSYTYVNNLPDMFRELASSDRRSVETRMVAPGGWRLRDHLEKGDARKALGDGKWDYVVLQDQSTLGVNYYVNGSVRVDGDEIFRPAAEEWITDIRKAGATPLFYLTWARKEMPEDQGRLTYAYMSAARAGRAVVAPVGLAWSLVRRTSPAIELFASDGSHPSPAGTYLAACTLFAAIFDRDPKGLPSVIKGRPVNPDTEQIMADQIVTLASLSESDARALQTAAWSAWQDLKRKGGYLVTTPPPIATVAPLPSGMHVEPSTPEGRWVGKLRFHPSGPADMVLTLRRDSAGLSGTLEIKYPAADIPLETGEVIDLRFGDDGIRFATAKSPAVAGLRVDFAGINVSDFELRGTAVAVGSDPASPLRLVGTWDLRMAPR